MTEAPLDPSEIREAQEGRHDARERLLEEVYRRLLPYCLRLTRGDPEEASEITQEAAFRCFRSLPELRAPDRLIPWVLRIATNLWRDRLRGGQDSPLPGEVEDKAARDGAEKRDTLLDLSRRLDLLPANYRVALTLRFLKGLDYEAMSQVLGVQQATLRMHVARGIRLLREQLDGEGRT